jgi:hypothetical protein
MWSVGASATRRWGNAGGKVGKREGGEARWEGEGKGNAAVILGRPGGIPRGHYPCTSAAENRKKRNENRKKKARRDERGDNMTYDELKPPPGYESNNLSSTLVVT